MGWVSSGRVSAGETSGLVLVLVRLPVWVGVCFARLVMIGVTTCGRQTGRALMLKKANVKFVNGRQSHLVNITSANYSRHVW